MSPIPGEPLDPKPPELTTPDGRKFRIKVPGLAPPPPHGDAGLVAWYGLATPAASRVVVTFFGHDFTARAVPALGAHTAEVLDSLVKNPS